MCINAVPQASAAAADSRSHVIQFIAKRPIIFRLVHGRICGAIHDNVDPIAFHELMHSLFVANIQLLYISEKTGVTGMLFRRFCISLPS